MQNNISLNIEEQVKKRTSELKNEKEISEKALINLDRQNSMIQVIIGSKNSEKLLSNINTILNKHFNLKSFIIYIRDERNEVLNVYDIIVNENENFGILDDIRKNSIPIDVSNSTHGSCIRNLKSLYISKVNKKYLCKEEIFNIELLGINAIHIIPMIYEDKAFGIITFTDNLYFKSNLRDLSKKDRTEIQNFVKLISPSIYQYLQKTILEETLIDLQETQSQLIEAERMASLGQLVGGVAHEINNPIGVIRSNSELILGNLDSILKKVPVFLESLSPVQKDVFYSMVNESIKNKEFLTTKEERARKKSIKQELSELLIENKDNLDYLTEQILTLKLTSPYQRYVTHLGEIKFIESLSIAQIFANQSRSIGNIEIAVEKATRVIFALRNYINTEMYSEKKEVDLVIDIEKSLHLYDNYIMGKVNIYKDYPKELKYTCTAENISQVWRHLIFNAIQAMYLTEKKLEIRMEIVSALPDRLREMQTSAIVEDWESGTKATKNWIMVSIVDSGHGIPFEKQDKIFTPFFTTKALGEGIGLGLYVIKKIVHEHGGRIYFASKEGRTEFCVVLPV